MTSHLGARAAIIATAMIFGLMYSLSAALIALDLAGRGFSDGVIGANAAMHAVGVLVMALVLPRLATRLGMRPTLIGSLLASTGLIVLFPALPSVWLWFPLRIALGAASEVLFVLSETWLNTLSTEQTRARTMAAYVTALSIGLALGPLILLSMGTQGFLPYSVGAVLALLAAAFVMSPGIKAPAFEKPAHGNPLHYMRLAPIAAGAAALNAAIETAGLTFFTLYAVSMGWDETQAMQLMPCLMLGAIVLQIPIGWLGDKMNRRHLIIVLAGLAAAGALLWPWVLQSSWLTFALLFLWGGLFVGIYTIMLTIVGSRFSGGDLVGIYAGMGLTWGAGALVGPPLARMAMQTTPHGLALFAAGACLCFMIFALAVGGESASSKTD